MPPSARSVDSLFEELVILGLLKQSKTVALKDYVGETPIPSVSFQAEERCPRAPATASLVAD